MDEYITKNKRAWEYNAYDFWVMDSGTPAERAEKIRENPKGALKRYFDYFDSFEGLHVANICGSSGKKAVPLALLGAEVTVFDISSENCRYAIELAEAAQTRIKYEVCNVMDIDVEQYGEYFDIVFMEGGILHYFHDLNGFMGKMNDILKPAGKMLCSDFHPFTKILDVLNFGQPIMSYFSTAVFEGEMPHARFYDEDIRDQFPRCLLRKYTISEILNAILSNGFIIRKLDEHPAWTNPDFPGEFTVIATKE